jgi:hypothetical protein
MVFCILGSSVQATEKLVLMGGREYNTEEIAKFVQYRSFEVGSDYFDSLEAMIKIEVPKGRESQEESRLSHLES